MTDLITDLLLLILAISVVWGKDLSRPGRWTRWPWFAVLLLGLVMVIASSVWGYHPLIPGGKPRELLRFGIVLLFFGIGISRHIRRDAADLRAPGTGS